MTTGDFIFEMERALRQLPTYRAVTIFISMADLIPGWYRRYKKASEHTGDTWNFSAQDSREQAGQTGHDSSDEGIESV